MSRIETMLTVIGEALVDVVHQHDGETRAYPGGSPMNVAVGARRLGHSTNFVGHYGPDAYGKSIDAHLEASQVTLPFEHSAARTSVAQATIGADGAAEYEFRHHLVPRLRRREAHRTGTHLRCSTHRLHRRHA